MTAAAPANVTVAPTDMLDVVQCRDVPPRFYRAKIAFEAPGTAGNATNLGRSRCEGTVSLLAQLSLLSVGLATRRGSFNMCDYSLQTVRSRPAKVGEKLTTHHFNTCTTGFAAPDDFDTAVCLLPGSELAFGSIVTCRPRGLFAWKPRVIDHMTAIFRQVNKDNPRTHHDALEFPDGQMVLLNDLFEGQEAAVLQLPAKPVSAAGVKAQERVSHAG